MKIDLDYMQKLLDVFIESPKAHITVDDWGKAGVIIENESGYFDEAFLFHLGLMLDNQLITNDKFEGFNLKSIGIDLSYGDHSYWEVDIRLTQAGHDFAKLLHQNEVLETLKNNFKDYPLKVMLEAGKELSTAFMKKKLKELGISE